MLSIGMDNVMVSQNWMPIAYQILSHSNIESMMKSCIDIFQRCNSIHSMSSIPCGHD